MLYYVFGIRYCMREIFKTVRLFLFTWVLGAVARGGCLNHSHFALDACDGGEEESFDRV